MFTSLETGIGLDIVIWLQSMQNGVFDFIASLMDFAGSDLFYIAALALIYWSVNRKLGTRMLFALILSGLLNTALKAWFQTPRPFVVSDEVRLLAVEQSNYGIPSGHVMNAVVVWGYLAWTVRKRWFTWAVVGFVALTAWSRMYGGVHYPQDAVIGAVLGLITLWGFIRLEESFPALWERLEIPPQVAMLVLAVVFAAVFTWTDEYGASLTGVLIGVGAGIILKKVLHFEFESPHSLPRRVLCFGVGIVALLIVFFGLRAAFSAMADDASATALILRVVRYGIVGLIGYWLYPLIAARVGLVDQTTPAAPSS
jgi:membrane-associated phospholipid phosphatase